MSEFDNLIKYEHSNLENLVGCGLGCIGAGLAMVIASPVLIPYGIYKGIKSLVKKDKDNGNNPYMSEEDYRKGPSGNDLPTGIGI